MFNKIPEFLPSDYPGVKEDNNLKRFYDINHYLSYKLKKIRTLGEEVDVSSEKRADYSVFERVLSIQKMGSGYVVQQIIVRAKECIHRCGEYNVILDRRVCYDSAGVTVIRSVSSESEVTEDLLVNQFRETKRAIREEVKKDAKYIVSFNDNRYIFEGICYGEVCEYVVLGQKVFPTLREVWEKGQYVFNDYDYIKNIVSLECEIVRADDKFEYPSYIEDYLGTCYGKDFQSLKDEVDRRNAAFQKRYYSKQLEVEKKRAFMDSIKEVIFFYLGLKYIIDCKEEFDVSESVHLKIDEFVERNSSLDCFESIKNAVDFIKSLDDRFDENNIEKSLINVKLKLDYAVPATEGNPINIYWHYSKVFPEIEGICLDSIKEETPLFENRFERGIRYIGIVRDIKKYSFSVDLFIRNTKQSILELGKNRFNNKRRVSLDMSWEYCKNKSDTDFDVNALPTKVFVHISKISKEFVEDIQDYVREGQYVEVYYLRRNQKYGWYDFTMIPPARP